MRGLFQLAEQPENLPNLAPRARTARGWLNNMGLHCRRIGKGVYIDVMVTSVKMSANIASKNSCQDGST